MIEQFKYINNLGRFETFKGTDETKLAPFTLVYSENGRGKTTICALMRSLGTGDPEPMHERRRVAADHGPHAVVVVDGEDVAFSESGWNGSGPTVLVFDDHFTATNVCSGLEVAAGHRQKLHELVVGEEGVRLQRRVEELTSEVSAQQSALRDAGSAIPPDALAGYDLDAFCQLPEIPSIDDEIRDAKQSASVLRDQDKVRTTAEFTPVALPVLPLDEVRQVLGAVLPDLEAGALAAVTSHFGRLGEGGEQWVSGGAKYEMDGGCPYCGQATEGVDLIAHYRTYFSEAYETHKAAIDAARANVEDEFGGDRLASFQRLLEQARKQAEFWTPYIEGLPIFGATAEEAASVWVGARDALLAALVRKGAAPLEDVVLHEEAEIAVRRYSEVATKLHALSSALLAENEAIAAAKEHATHGSLFDAEARLAVLEATKQRHEPNIARKCADYIEAKAKKAAAEVGKVAAREALDAHRTATFGKYQTSINKFLDTFSAGFRLEALSPADPRGIPTSTYVIGVNRERVPLASKKPEPSFGTALSAGDRSTLALAFFFAMLSERESLDDAVVVIDDPASSMDDGRCISTAQEIRKLRGRAGQVVVLSHARRFLSQLWDKGGRDGGCALEIRNDGPESSTIGPWDADAAAITEYDRDLALVRNYADDSLGDAVRVAAALRLVLEGYCRVAFADHYPPGTLLWRFISTARQAISDGRPVLTEDELDELDDLREYANQFHHNSNSTWQESLANVNETQLGGFARRVMAFVRGRARS